MDAKTYPPVMDSERRQSHLVVGVLPALALVLLVGSGLVLATSWFVDYSAPVLVVAACVALVAVITVAVSGWREARRMGVGYLGSLAASMKRPWRFALDFI